MLDKHENGRVGLYYNPTQLSISSNSRNNLLFVSFSFLLSLKEFIANILDVSGSEQNNSDEISDYLDNSTLGSAEKTALTSETWTIKKLAGELICLRHVQIQGKS